MARGKNTFLNQALNTLSNTVLLKGMHRVYERSRHGAAAWLNALDQARLRLAVSSGLARRHGRGIRIHGCEPWIAVFPRGKRDGSMSQNWPV